MTSKWRSGYFRQLPGELLHRELYRDNLVCVADKKHPLLKRGRMDEKSYLAARTSPWRLISIWGFNRMTSSPHWD